MLGSSLSPVVCRRAHVLFTLCVCVLCLLAHGGVQHMLCCVFVLFFFVLYTLCCQLLWIVHFWFLIRYSLTFNYYATGRWFSQPMKLTITQYIWNNFESDHIYANQVELAIRAFGQCSAECSDRQNNGPTLLVTDAWVGFKTQSASE